MGAEDELEVGALEEELTVVELEEEEVGAELEDEEEGVEELELDGGVILLAPFTMMSSCSAVQRPFWESVVLSSIFH